MADKAYRIRHDVYDEMYRAGLLPDASLLYLFLLNNPRVSLTGLYRIDEREITFHTGIGQDRVLDCLRNLTNAGLIVYDQSLLWIPRIPRDNTATKLTYWQRLLQRDEEEYAAYPSIIPGCENGAYRAWREAHAQHLAPRDQQTTGPGEKSPAPTSARTAADVIPPWERAAETPDSSDDEPGTALPMTLSSDETPSLPTQYGVGTYQEGTSHPPAPSNSGGLTPLPTTLYLSLSLPPPEEDRPIESRGCGGIAGQVPGGGVSPPPAQDPHPGDNASASKRWRVAVQTALQAMATAGELRRWVSSGLLTLVLVPRTWPEAHLPSDTPPPAVTIPFRPLDGDGADDWTPNGDMLPRSLSTIPFLSEWARYLRWRWLTWHEWPDRVTQTAQWLQLAEWFDPIACVRQSVAGSFKGIFPLREDLGSGRYTRSGTVLRASRRARSAARRGGCVTDTVIGYAPRLTPDTGHARA
ncbi:MAG: hypothetical protein BGO89_06705 [Candidatus Kapaibacterium thiocyanatum]|uniref:Uncharacterized protein n=1 Tax=Candidatus Kapaibacterium thiocyanatum TaxID=1895771 RepID=A0A1M3KYU1_9BACT|nr:MAG: hypothetical protein BGO89_06705 ['Candidatus Kapabacteria' thiocyanatum]